MKRSPVEPGRIVEHLLQLLGEQRFVAPIDEALINEELEEVFRDPPDFDRRPFHREMNAQVTAFFQEEL